MFAQLVLFMAIAATAVAFFAQANPEPGWSSRVLSSVANLQTAGYQLYGTAGL